MTDRYEELWREFEDRAYRIAYADSQLDSNIATQLKIVRDQRGHSQSDLAAIAEMHQSRISVMEDVNYSSWSISTLKRLAAALDCALQVRLVPYEAVIDNATSMTASRLLVPTLEDSKRARAARRRRPANGETFTDVKMVKASLRMPSFTPRDSTTQAGVRGTVSASPQGNYSGQEAASHQAHAVYR